MSGMAVRAWVAWIRAAAVPFVLLEVAVEHGNYPPRHEPWAWAVAGAFSTGAIALVVQRRRARAAAAGLALDTLVVSNYVALYGFEPSSPVRQVLVLVVVEAALLYARRGAFWAVTSAPALAIFEWRASDALDVPYDPGHVVFPIGVQLLVGLVVGSLVARADAG